MHRSTTTGSPPGASSYPNDQFDIKIDHRFSQNNLMSAKYSQQWNSPVCFNCFGNFADPMRRRPQPGSAHLFTINDDHTFTKTLLLTAILGFTRGAEQILAYNGARRGYQSGEQTWLPVVSELQRVSGCAVDVYRPGDLLFRRLHEHRRRSLRELPAGPGYGTAHRGAEQGAGRSRTEVRIRRPAAPDELHPDQRARTASSISITSARRSVPTTLPPAAATAWPPS